MPKRKHSQDDLDRIQRKIKKLEKKLKKRLNSVSSDTSSELEEVLPLADYGADTPALQPTDWLFEDTASNDRVVISVPATQPDPMRISSSPQAGPSSLDLTPLTEEGQTVTTEKLGLDSEILEILGENPGNDQKYGPEIHGELANRINFVATKGLTKESRKDLLTKYLTPSNCAQIDAPKLNMEIKAAISETAVKRDKGIEAKQKQMASAIACLSDVINTHITSKSKNNELLQKMMDINRLLCDIQHADSVTRRNFILFSIKSGMNEHLKNTKIDSFLFGEDLPETLKSAKAVNKSGADLKPELVKPSGPRRFNPVGQKPLPLNRRAPAQALRVSGPAPVPHQTLPMRRRENNSRYHTTRPHLPPHAHTSRPSQQQRNYPPPPQRRRQ